MDLEVAAVDPVVVSDDERCQLHILMLERFQRSVELGDDHVQAPERGGLEPHELALEGGPPLGHQPNFPVT